MSPVSAVRQLSHYAGWYIRSIFGKKDPLVNTMVIHYGCNLRCTHCAVTANEDEGRLSGPRSMTWELATKEMRSEYNKGSRIVFFEGGEPTIWKDGDRRFIDLIDEAHRMGYYVVGYTTNGTGTIYEQSDVISVSLDGPREVHDRLRAPGVYDMLMENLAKTTHQNIFANMTVSKLNQDVIRETAEIVRNSPQIRGLMINFLTPPPSKFTLTYDEKEAVVKEALGLKKEGFPIVNSKRALKELLITDYTDKCPYWVSSFMLPDGTKHYGCPMRAVEACRDCGFDAVREYRLITAGNVDTIFSMSRFAISKPPK
ncbi:MAG: radical SAM protein [Euryarchaeota archaeon]|nr:radical SAM protein [Euryarchaeota archaeon]